MTFDEIVAVASLAANDAVTASRDPAQRRQQVTDAIVIALMEAGLKQTGDEPPVDPPPPVDIEAEVSRLLKASRSAHAAYRQAAQKRNYPSAEASVAAARDARQAAHDLDPEHEAPEWGNDKASHADLMAFYVRYPEIP
jgi:hypothetical protein